MNVSSLLRTISSSLQTPVVVILLILIAVTIVIFGTLIAELILEKRYFRVNKKMLPDLLEDIHREPEKLEEHLNKSNLLKRQKELLIELTLHPTLPDCERESLAVRLVEHEQEVYDRRTKVTDIIARIGPMIGLLGTLIPLGPGILALGQGDTYTLSASLLTAFDTTVAGLVCACVALIISTVRKGWYRKYMSVLDMLAECVLEEQKND